MKKIIIILSIFTFISCASFGVWTDDAKENISAFISWADKWVGGAVIEASTIISGIEKVTGSTKETTAAKDALVLASSILTSFKSLTSIGNNTGISEQDVVNAINQVNSTMDEVNKLIK